MLMINDLVAKLLQSQFHFSYFQCVLELIQHTLKVAEVKLAYRRGKL